MKPVITVEGLGKKYTLRHQQREPYTALRDVIVDGAVSLGKKLMHPLRRSPAAAAEEFWALKDVSFEVKQGDRIGIIGRNGAGKSTLLKILSRITEPTAGEVHIRGRVASLLEVGTGFHPELTGRENIFLNGAILGMSRAEIRKKFDEIVDFAEIEKFLDTPVKRYSSGMYVRLAFAVAAHLEPEILVVDEVLAVGDAQFQKKCFGKMQTVGQEGRTVLFVSHNMAAVENLCTGAIMLEKGCIIASGEVNCVVQGYLSKMNTEPQMIMSRSGPVNLVVSVFSGIGERGNIVQCGDKLQFIADIITDRPFTQAGFGIGITNIAGERIITFHSHYQYQETWRIDRKCTCTIKWPENILCPGTYILVAAIYDGNQLVASWHNAGMLTVVATDYFGTGKLPDSSHQGQILARASWAVTSDYSQKQTK